MIDGNKFFAAFLIVVGLILLLVPMDTPPMQEEDDEWLHDYPEESEEDRILETAAEQEEVIVEEATVIAIRGIDYGSIRSGMPCELPGDRAFDMEKQPEPLPDPADIISLADIPEETAAPENIIQAYDQTASVPVAAAEPAPAAEEEIAEGSYERETGEEEAPEGDEQGYEEGAADPSDAEERRVDDDGPEGDEGYSEGEHGTDARVCPIYSVVDEGGVVRTLAPELQVYAYRCLEERGVSWYYPYFICQMFQESRFNQGAVSASGDYGLCQIKGAYHAYLAELAGIPGADLINDPYANIYVGAYIMADNLSHTGSLEQAISRYNTGTDAYNAAYVQQVTQWFGRLLEN